MLGVIEATHPFIRPTFRPLCLFASLWKRSVCAWSTHATSQSQPTSCEVREAQTRVLDGNILRPRSEAHTPECWKDDKSDLGHRKTIFKGSDYVTWCEGSILMTRGNMDWGQNLLHLKMDFWKKVRWDLIPWMKICLSDMCWLQKVWCFMEVVKADCQINAFGSLWLSTLIHHPATVVHTFLLSPSVHIVIQCMR